MTKSGIFNLQTFKSPSARPPVTELSDPFAWPLASFPFVEGQESCNKKVDVLSAFDKDNW